MKEIGIVVKPDTEAIKKADELESWLRSKNIEIVKRENVPPKQRVSDRDKSSAPADLCCVFVLGGDGTFLSAVCWIEDQKIPILGVKFREVGFLAEIAEESLFAVAEAVLNNKFTKEPRMRTIDNQMLKLSALSMSKFYKTLPNFWGFGTKAFFFIKIDNLKPMLSNHDRNLCLTPYGLLPIIFLTISESF